ncbi:MAG: S41 family peptidase [Chloroflexota bacterium]
MTNRTAGSNVLLRLFLGLVALGLCGLMTLAGFWIGRQTAPTPESSQPEVAVQVETVEVTRVVTAVAAPQDDQSAAAESTPSPLPPTPSPTEPPTRPAAGGPGDFEQSDLDILWEVWNLIEDEYDGELPTDEDVTYSVVNGAIETLNDPFTAFLPPEVANRVREQLQGSFEGIGAFVDLNEEGFLVIVRPIDGQPADLAGVRAGDVVTAVDGESIAGQTLDEMISRVRGPRGTEVTLTIVREGVEQPFDVTIVRARIEIPIVESEMLPDNVAYIHLTSFSSNAEEQVLLALDDLLPQNPRGIIFDLRDNGGGFLDQSVAVADIFLPEGVVLFERNNRGLEQVYRSDDGDVGETLPLVVLVNAGSASASEIVAGAIQDHSRGVLIGEITFGKGSVQQPHNLSDGSELRVTIARWYTPNNQSISGQGITPDIEVPTPEDLGGPEDTQIQRAVEYILTGN